MATVQDLPASLDYQNPGAQVVRDGRKWTVEVELYLPVEATSDQVLEGVEFALGCGSLPNDHPLIDGMFNSVSATSARRENWHRVVFWTAQEDGRRSGYPRTIRDGEEVSVTLPFTPTTPERTL